MLLVLLCFQKLFSLSLSWLCHKACAASLGLTRGAEPCPTRCTVPAANPAPVLLSLADDHTSHVPEVSFTFPSAVWRSSPGSSRVPLLPRDIRGQWPTPPLPLLPPASGIFTQAPWANSGHTAAPVQQRLCGTVPQGQGSGPGVAGQEAKGPWAVELPIPTRPGLCICQAHGLTDISPHLCRVHRQHGPAPQPTAPQQPP